MDKVLLRRYFENKCTREEAEEVLRWSDSPEFEEQILALMSTEDKVLHEDQIKSERILGNIRAKIDEAKGSGNRNYLKDREPVRNSKRKAKTGVYFLVAVVAIAGILMVRQTVNFGSSLVVQATQKGEKKEWLLKDGTIVYLNSSSSISYTENYGDIVREVILHGEATFKVASDPKKPFIVSSGDVKTTALGTEFNIRNRLNSSLQISLLEGKVKVESEKENNQMIILKPGERAVWQNSVLLKNNFNAIDATAWKEDIIFFDDAKIFEIKETLENVFNVEISFKGDVPEYVRYTGKFEKESLQNVLEGMQFSLPFDYHIEERKVNLMFK